MEASTCRRKTLRRCIFRMAVAAGLLPLTACAVQRPFRFAPRNISKISYDPKNCVEMLDGKFKCQDVIFTVNAVQIASDK